LAHIHARQLYEAGKLDPDGRNWTYLSCGPFASFEDFRLWVQAQAARKDLLMYAIVDAASGMAVGVAAYLRIDPENGVIEIGHLNFSPLLQKTVAATEAIYLMIENAFGMGYRRCEWKCNALNEVSRRAALRFGFLFEGVFRQLVVVKGRSRDTAWFSIINGEWPALKAAFEQWLAPANFDEQGRQKLALSSLTTAVRKA
jgi:RimJ/RimL family protein N-acetyltransferase